MTTLHTITLRKSNKFILNSQNSDVKIDGTPLKGVKEFGISIKAPENPSHASIAEVTIKMIGYVEFEQATDAEIAADEAARRAAEENAKLASQAASALSGTDEEIASSEAAQLAGDPGPAAQ